MTQKIKIKLKDNYVSPGMQCEYCGKEAQTYMDCSDCYKMTCISCIGYCTSDSELHCQNCWKKCKKQSVPIVDLCSLSCRGCDRKIGEDFSACPVKLVCNKCGDNKMVEFYVLCQSCVGGKIPKIRCSMCGKLLEVIYVDREEYYD